jgi:hypothetical protein
MEKKVVHEVKLQKSVIVILSVMAVSIFALAFKDYVTPALADYDRGNRVTPIYINCTGCN